MLLVCAFLPYFLSLDVGVTDFKFGLRSGDDTNDDLEVVPQMLEHLRRWNSASTGGHLTLFRLFLFKSFAIMQAIVRRRQQRCCEDDSGLLETTRGGGSEKEVCGASWRDEILPVSRADGAGISSRVFVRIMW